jgi:ribonuclease HI
MNRQVERTREERRELLETTKLSKLPKLPVRNSFNNLKMEENKLNFEIPEDIFPNPNIELPFFKGKAGAKLTIECDSICHPNPEGIGCWAFVAFDEKGRNVGQSYGCIGNGKGITNNVAEYHSVISALKWSLGRNEVVTILSSSSIVVNQFNRTCACHKEHLQLLLQRVDELADLTKAKICWIPQKENKVVEAIRNVALELVEGKFQGGKNEQ